jgi:hypothetical protein
MRWLADQGVVLESARGALPSVIAYLAGEPVRGSWWSHAHAREFYRVIQELRRSPDILVCRLGGGKLTLVHRSCWPALVRLGGRWPRELLARVFEEHTPTGRHQVHLVPFPDWVPAEVIVEAYLLSEDQAIAMLPPAIEITR